MAAHRLLSAPPADVFPILGHFGTDFVTTVPAIDVADADGTPVPDCVFADLLTGLVVQTTPAGLRAANRKAPLARRGG